MESYASTGGEGNCKWRMEEEDCNPGEPGNLRQNCLVETGGGGDDECNSGGCGAGLVKMECGGSGGTGGDPGNGGGN